MTWSEILQAAGMEPELAAAFDLIELRTPSARTVTDLIAALTTVHGDVEGMQGEISSVHERLTALEETDSSLAHLLGEILVELRVLQRRTGEHFPRTEQPPRRPDRARGCPHHARGCPDRHRARQPRVH